MSLPLSRRGTLRRSVESATFPQLPTGAAAGTVGATSPKFSDLTQIVIPHDNAGGVNPKDTIEGARALIGSGWTGLLDWNVQMAGDGTLFCLHDATVDPQTTASGNGYDQTAASVAQLIVDNVPSPWPTTTIKVPTVAQVLEAFPHALHHFEIKSGSLYGQGTRFANGDVATALVALIKRYGRQDGVLISSFTDAELQVVRTTSAIPTMLILPTEGFPVDYTGGTMTAASLWASGTKIINPDATRSTIATDVPAWHTIGFKVIAGTPDRRVDRDKVIGYGCDGWVTNNPLYLSRSTQARKVDLWKSGARTDGLIGYDSTHQGVVTGGGMRINTTGVLFVLMGDVSYGASGIPTTYSITFDMVCNAVGSDLTRHWDMVVCSPTDDKYQDVAAATENGYLLFHKPNGSASIQTKTAGVLGTASGGSDAGYTTGDTLTYRLDVTASNVKLTVVSKNGTTVNTVLFNFATTAWRGGYFFLGRNDGGGAGSGLDVTFKNLVTT